MDDGSSVWVGRGKNKHNSVRVSFATYSFMSHELNILCDKLRGYGFHPAIDYSVSKNHGHGFSIRLSQTDSYKFMIMIYPIISKINCMRYKIKVPGDLRLD